MATWTKPNGTQIELNDEEATTQKAKSLGWTSEATAEKPKPKRKRRTKAEMEAARNGNSSTVSKANPQ